MEGKLILDPDLVNKNTLAIGLYSVKHLLKIYIILFFIVLFFWLLSYANPNLVADSRLDNNRCQDQLKFNSFVNNHNAEFESLIRENDICFFCMQKPPKTLPYGVAVGIFGSFNETFTPINTLKSTFSVVTSTAKSSDSCMKDGLSFTGVKNFPYVTLPKSVKDYKIAKNSQGLTLSWKCYQNDRKKIWMCESKQLVFQSNHTYKSISLYHKIQSNELNQKKASIEYFLLEYNEKYFVFNEILYMIWIGIEIMFFLLICGLKEKKKETDEKILIQTHGKYGQIMLAVFLNNDCVFIFQVFSDNNTLRLIHMICQSASTSFIFYYIFSAFRNIRALRQSPSKVSLFLDIFITGIFFGSLANCQYHLNLIMRSQILHDAYTQGLFQILEYELTLVQSTITGMVCYLAFQVTYTWSKLPKSLDGKSSNLYFVKSMQQFIIFSILFGFSIILRLAYQYMIQFSPELTFFDQVQTVLINMFFILCWWFFDSDVESVMIQINDDDPSNELVKIKRQLFNPANEENEIDTDVLKIEKSPNKKISVFNEFEDNFTEPNRENYDETI